MRAAGRISYTGSRFRFTDESRFVSLSVAGHSVNVHVNTKITLRGIGYVLLHERHRSVRLGRASQSIAMIHVVVSRTNVYGLRTGTNIVVGVSSTVLTTRMPGGLLTGGAYGSHARVGNRVISGYSALVSLPCLGGQTSNRVVGVTVPTGSAETIVDTASGIVGPRGSSGTVTSTTHSLKLLKGLIAANVVQAQVGASSKGGTRSFSDSSTFAKLKVRGVRLTVKPNTLINLGFAKLYLHRRIRTARSLTVRMVELVVTGPNVYGLRAGMDLQVGVARIGFKH